MSVVADAALGAVGARFRLHGRDAATGLDCVGLAALALRAGGWDGDVPTGYALRGGDVDRVVTLLGTTLTRSAGGTGDLLLLRAGPAQLHLAIMVDEGIVHADAGLGRVVLRPGAPPWPVLGAWRLPDCPSPAFAALGTLSPEGEREKEEG